jgi:anti-sigma-K factor RskA
MNLANHPQLLDQLASAYALGSLRGGARRRFEALARQSPVVRSAALLWQERFAAITELQPAGQPSPNVWKRIENLIEASPSAAAATPTAAPAAERLRRVLGWWRGAALAGAVATVGAVAVGLNLNQEVQRREGQLAQAGQQREALARQNAQLNAQLQARPEIQYVAVLSDEKANASILVTFDPRQNRLTLKRVGEFEVGADKSLELWALPRPGPGGAPAGGPRSLGVLEGGPVVRLTAAPGQVQEAPALAITLEPKGGVPPGSGPTGPVLFKGALLQTAT